MEQRPETPSPVVLGAGTDPTHIPGLDTPGTGDPGAAGEAAPEARETAEPAEPGLDSAADEENATSQAEPGGEEETPPDGPAFEVCDHRSSILADGLGVVFRLDDTEARFRWDEIGSVEIGTSRFGRRFEVAVGTTDHRRFEAEVIASSKVKLKEWTTELDAVLDAWFDAGK